MLSGSPPLARGVRDMEIMNTIAQRITPACAGSTIPLLTVEEAIKDHPRLRGEYVDFTENAILILGSPPLARGVLDHCNERATLVRITPACAGSTCSLF